jgi:SCP-2 sterol transfer family
VLDAPRRFLEIRLIRLLDAFPSSEAFEAINAALQSSDAERKDAIKQGNAVFAFTLKNKAGETESWHIDLKNKGEVGKGLGDKPTGKKAFLLAELITSAGQ